MAGFLAELSPTALVLLLTPITLITYYILFAPRIEFSPKAPKQTSEQYPVVGALAYFSAKWDFYRRSSRESPSGNFSFYLGRNAVVGLSGEIGRDVFYNTREFGISQGQALNPRIPGPPELPGFLGKALSLDDDDFSPVFLRFLRSIFTTERFARDLPVLVHDAKEGLRTLATSSSTIINPFDVLFKVIFQLTARELCCSDIADQTELLDKMIQLFLTAGTSYNPRIILFPPLIKWLSPAYWKQMSASIRMYMLVKDILDQRKRTGKRGTDPLQHLIDQGLGDATLIQMLLTALFAGIENSGKNAAWNLIYLSLNPTWKAKVLDEIKAAVAKYTTDRTAPFIEQLSSLPLEAWEREFPAIDMVLTETIRLQIQGVLFRKNVGGSDIKVGDEIIPNGAFVLYHNADVHLDPSIYPDPLKWDPSRHLPENPESKKKRKEFLGWGAGKHSCGGIRFAKFENNIAVVLFLATYDFELCDEQGRVLKNAPEYNVNSQSSSQPDSPAYIRIWPREEMGEGLHG